MRITKLCALVLAAIASYAPQLHAQKTPPKSAAEKGTNGQFVILKGIDTVAVENFFRDASVLTGQVVQSAGPRNEYTMLLRQDFRIEHADITRKFKTGGQVSLALDFTDKAVDGTVTAADGSEKLNLTTTLSPTPFLVFSFALAEQIVRAAALPVGQSTKFLAIRLASADSATVTVSRFHADSASLIMQDVGIKVALSADGRVTGGTHTTQLWTVKRTR